MLDYMYYYVAVMTVQWLKKTLPEEQLGQHLSTNAARYVISTPSLLCADRIWV